MSKISGWNFSQNITSADNCKQKNEDLDTWYGLVDQIQSWMVAPQPAGRA